MVVPFKWTSVASNDQISVSSEYNGKWGIKYKVFDKMQVLFIIFFNCTIGVEKLLSLSQDNL